MYKKFTAAVGAAAVLILCGAMATAPTVAMAATYAAQRGPSIRGIIESIPGKYSIEVRTPSGKIDAVSLHQGTIINPTGITLEPGFRVRISGYSDGSTFVANEIDTPYHYIPVSYAPAPYGDGLWANPYWGVPYWPAYNYVYIVRR